MTTQNSVEEKGEDEKSWNVKQQTQKKAERKEYM